MEYSRVLAIAGSDSGGGAGIQADIKAISACGCYAASAITAVTAQNTTGVREVAGLPLSLIGSQIEAVLDDIGADSVKIGMLHSADVVRTVARELKRYSVSRIVLDPVMVAKSGDRLIEDGAVDVLKRELIPMACVITPNIAEAEILLGQAIPGQDSMPEAAVRLGETYGVSVLLKAGHMKDDEVKDIFFNRESGRISVLASRRIDTPNTHGTGCTFSSAFAAMLAKGLGLDEAARESKRYVDEALRAGAAYAIGQGHGPVFHFYNYWKH